jgi:hypothetical protein
MGVKIHQKNVAFFRLPSDRAENPFRRTWVVILK